MKPVLRWRIGKIADGKRVLGADYRCDTLEDAYAIGHAVAYSFIGTPAENDCYISVSPFSVSVVMHIYHAGPIPSEYTEIAKQADKAVAALQLKNTPR